MEYAPVVNDLRSPSGGRVGSRRRERMLDDKKQQADRYRTRAGQIRTTAEAMTHHESRIALLRLADSYDRLALRIEYERTSSS